MPIIVTPGAPVVPPTTVTSSDGHLTATTDPTYAGVLLKADFSGLATKPVQVRFYRGSLPVRSGDAAWTPGGSGVAYDHEAPLGTACSWTAVPIFADGTIGAASTAATLTTPAMAGDVDCWVKPLDDPGKSVAFPVHTDQVAVGQAGRLTTNVVPGRKKPIGAYDKRTPKPVSITLRTTTKAEKDALNDALDEGPVLVQLRDIYGIDDFYALPDDSDERYFVGMFSPLRDIPSIFVPCDRPPTIDAPSFIPGHSIADQLALAPLISDGLAMWPTIANAVGLP